MSRPNQRTIRREMITLLIGSLILIASINVGRYLGMQQERHLSALSHNLHTFELHLNQTMRGTSEALLTQGTFDSIQLIKQGIAGTDQQLEQIETLAPLLYPSLFKQWSAIRTQLKPFLHENDSGYYDDSLLLRYGQMLGRMESLLSDSAAQEANFNQQAQVAMRQMNLIFTAMVITACIWVAIVFRRLVRRISTPLREIVTKLQLDPNAAEPSEAIDQQLLQLRVRQAIFEQWLSATPQEKLYTEMRELGTTINGLLRYQLGTMQAQQRQSQHLSLHNQHLSHQATHDPLTQLPNRAYLNNLINTILLHGQAEPQPFALMMIDLDGFKRVNDTYGHPIGDQLLRSVSDRFSKSLRQGDVICRLGGDEFAAILVNYREISDLEEIASRTIDSASRPFHLEGHHVTIGASIGITIHPQDGDTFADLISHADAALYAAKEAGKGCHRFFSPALNYRNQVRHMMEQTLREAMERGTLFLEYLPLMDMHQQRPIGAEALLRLHDQDAGLIIHPQQFIPIANESGLIMEIGHWVIEQACIQFSTWKQQGTTLCSISVNISVVQLRHPLFADDVLRLLDEHGMHELELELEITEATLLDKTPCVLKNIQELASAGVTIAIDDFGTDYASLCYLSQLPIRAIKINATLIASITTNGQHQNLISAIIQASQQMGIEVIAEGVENQEQQQFLLQHHCHLAQGFLFTPALHANQWDHWYHQPMLAAATAPVARAAQV